MCEQYLPLIQIEFNEQERFSINHQPRVTKRERQSVFQNSLWNRVARFFRRCTCEFAVYELECVFVDYTGRSSEMEVIGNGE